MYKKFRGRPAAVAVTTASVLALCGVGTMPADANAAGGLSYLSPSEQALYEQVIRSWRQEDMCLYLDLYWESPRYNEVLQNLIYWYGSRDCAVQTEEPLAQSQPPGLLDIY